MLANRAPQVLTVTRSIEKYAFFEDGYSDPGSGYAAGDKLTVTLTVTASEAVTLERFQIQENLPEEWGLAGGDFSFQYSEGSFKLLIKPEIINEDWLDFTVELEKTLEYEVNAKIASYVLYSAGAAFSSDYDNGFIDATPLSGYAIGGPAIGDDFTFNREGDAITLTAVLPDDGSVILYQWLNDDDPEDVLGEITNPLEMTLASSLTVTP